MFRVVFQPSSGAHNTVSTVSGINETCTAAISREVGWTCTAATCRERGWTCTAATCRERGWTCSRPAMFTTGSSCTGLINARYCRYSVMSSWWWVKYHPKHVEQLTDLNKLCSVASCWIIIATSTIDCYWSAEDAAAFVTNVNTYFNFNSSDVWTADILIKLEQSLEDIKESFLGDITVYRGALTSTASFPVPGCHAMAYTAHI